MKKIFTLIILAATVLSLMTAAEAKRFGDDYQLEKVLILSRHNLRTPHINEIKELTPHKWFKWSAGSRELSLRGGLVETELGQYFRKYLVDENFMPENYLPAEGEFRFYANSRQRTVATAKYFSGGFLPVANVTIEYKEPIEKSRDKTFNTRLTFLNDRVSTELEAQLLKLFGVNNPRDVEKKFFAEFALMEKVLDFKNSPYAKKTGEKTFRSDDAEFIIADGKQPAFKGKLTMALDASDALILQYYETGTAFGQKLNDKQWKQVAKYVDVYNHMVAVPAAAINIAQPLIKVMNDEISNDSRKFTFLCGHDTNIGSVAGALNVEDYSLPDTIELHTPIGCKFVIEKWRGRDGEDYASVFLVYPSSKQIQNIETLDLDNPPKIFPLRLKGLQANSDGLYRFSDVKARFAEILKKYDNLKQK